VGLVAETAEPLATTKRQMSAATSLPVAGSGVGFLNPLHKPGFRVRRNPRSR